MTHGTIPWEGSDERRTLFYKYVPYGMHHADACYDVNDPELTLQQREILEFPEVLRRENMSGDSEAGDPGDPEAGDPGDPDEI